MTNRDDDMIDDLFGLAQSQTPAPSDDLMARILADAAAVQPSVASASPPQAGFMQSLMDLIGGWPSVGGLAMAGVAGIWVGFAPPTVVSDWTAELVGTPVTIDMLGSTDSYFLESMIDG